MWTDKWEHSDKKNANVKNIHKRRKSKTKENNLTKQEKFSEGLDLWISYWRENPHRFVTEYLQITPFSVFQAILLVMMFDSNYFLWWASRGLGKSYLSAIYCVVRCILYPGTKICIAAGTKGQSINILSEKIQEFYDTCPNVAREIIDLRTTTNDPVVKFANGSWIKVVAATDNARSARANVILVDEFIQVKADIIKKVLRKFLTSRRSPGFLDKPEYQENKNKWVEPNTEIYLSSAGFKSHWSWDRFLAFKDKMLEGKKYFACGLPYQMGVKYGVIDKTRIIDEMLESDFDPIAFSMEMECIPFGESGNAHFSFEELNKSRQLVNAFYPPTIDEFIRLKDKYGDKYKYHNKSLPDKKDGEIRIVSMDIALMQGSGNDATCFTLIRAIPSRRSYTKFVDYIEVMEGEHTMIQSNRLKQLYYDYDADVCVMDTNGNGMSVFDQCSQLFIDPDRGTEYPAWSAFNDDRMKERAYEKDALPIIYSVKVSGAHARQINHEMAEYTRVQFEKGKVKLLQTELDIQGTMMKSGKYMKMSADERIDKVLPHFNTTRLITEMINLDKDVSGGLIRLTTASRSGRKDRYSSLSYGLYYIKEQELKLKDKDKKKFEWSDYILY